jgi:acyl carrier protein
MQGQSRTGRRQDSPGALLKEDLDVDSLDLIEVAMALEDVYSLTLQEDEMDNIKTVGDIVSLIEARLKVKSA